MAHPLRLVSWLAVAVRLRRESGGSSTLAFAIGAALAVGTVAVLSTGVQGRLGETARRTAVALDAQAASAPLHAAEADSEWQAEIDRAERYAEEAERQREAAEAAKDQDGFWDVLGSIFGGPIVGTAIGSAIEDFAGSSESDETAAEDEVARATLESGAVPGWSRENDDD